MACLESLTATLETTFTRIQRERMVDVPILNPVLRVQAVGFRTWQEYCVGVLITPWFMNLMLLAEDGDKWAGLPSGTKIKQVFPSGDYEFTLGEEQGIGRYLMCALFSPVFEFHDQETAVATADAVMKGIMEEVCRDDVSTREREILKIWHGEDEATGEDAVTDCAEQPRPGLEQLLEKPVSRRDLLRGAFLGRKE